MVFRRVRGKTIIAQRPDIQPRKSSAAQQAQRERFALAREYAKQVLADPWQRQAYDQQAKRRNRRTDLLVVSDFLTPPVVELIDVSGFHRTAGGTIRILAEDDVEVVSVEVTIQTASGTLLERGFAVPVHGVWCYRNTTGAPAGESLTVTATARDRPGHAGVKSVTVPGFADTAS